jgi:hypothetical protein
MNLRHAAFRLRCEIERILATPTEAPGRIEDIIHDALAELDDGVRRAVCREASE